MSAELRTVEPTSDGEELPETVLEAPLPHGTNPRGTRSAYSVLVFGLQGICLLAAAKLPAVAIMLVPSLGPAGWTCLEAILLADGIAYACILLAMLWACAALPAEDAVYGA